MKYILELKNNGRLFDSFMKIIYYIQDSELKDAKAIYLGKGNWKHDLYAELEGTLGDNYFCDDATDEFKRTHNGAEYELEREFGFESDRETAYKYCKHTPVEILPRAYRIYLEQLEPILTTKKSNRKMNPKSLANLKQNRKTTK